MKTPFVRLAACCILVALLAACGIPTVPATKDANQVITEAAMTVAVQLTQQATSNPLPSATAQPATATTAPTAAPTEPLPTQAPAATSTSVPQPTTAGAAPDSASFVTDVTVPDGTAANPGAVFLKTWRVKNTGSTTWSAAYTLNWVDGDKMGVNAAIPLPKEVRPGEEVDISVQLTAPATPGTYQTYFRLRNEAGQYFRLDGGGDLWVKIVVGLGATATVEPSATPTTAP